MTSRTNIPLYKGFLHLYQFMGKKPGYTLKNKNQYNDQIRKCIERISAEQAIDQKFTQTLKNRVIKELVHGWHMKKRAYNKKISKFYIRTMSIQEMCSWVNGFIYPAYCHLCQLIRKKDKDLFFKEAPSYLAEFVASLVFTHRLGERFHNNFQEMWFLPTVRKGIITYPLTKVIDSLENNILLIKFSKDGILRSKNNTDFKSTLHKWYNMKNLPRWKSIQDLKISKEGLYTAVKKTYTTEPRKNTNRFLNEKALEYKYQNAKDLPQKLREFLLWQNKRQYTLRPEDIKNAFRVARMTTSMCRSLERWMEKPKARIFLIKLEKEYQSRLDKNFSF